MNAHADHMRRYYRRKEYARRHGLRPASYWDLPDEAELIAADRVVHVPLAPRTDPTGPGQFVAHCQRWHKLEALPFVCPRCQTRLFEEVAA